MFNYGEQAYYICLLRAIIACNHLSLFKLFSRFVHFCPNFQIALFHYFFYKKITPMPLISINRPWQGYEIFKDLHPIMWKVKAVFHPTKTIGCFHL